MKFTTNLLICLLLSIKFSYAETTKVDPVKKLGSTLKAITGKSLNKEETKQFLSDYVLILEDERSDGTVTIFLMIEIIPVIKIMWKFQLGIGDLQKQEF